jgi:hypothetical protein
LVAAGRKSAAAPGGLNSKKGGAVLILRMARHLAAARVRPAGNLRKTPYLRLMWIKAPEKSIS